MDKNGNPSTQSICSVAPTTCSIVTGIPSAFCPTCTSKWSVLGPNSHIGVHCGPTNARLRIHLGLKVLLSFCVNFWTVGNFVYISFSRFLKNAQWKLVRPLWLGRKVTLWFLMIVLSMKCGITRVQIEWFSFSIFSTQTLLRVKRRRTYLKSFYEIYEMFRD